MDARDVRRERRKEQVRQEILDATKAVLLARGLGGLTLAAVAREVELTKAALYYYFPSKEALVFELVHDSLKTHAEVVGGALEGALSGPQAIEVLIRASSDYYRSRMDELRLAYLVPQVGSAGSHRFGPEMAERIRPFNDQMYGTVAERIGSDQQAGRIPQGLDGRRIAFVAHMAVVGILTVQGLVEVANDEPLMHSPAVMVDELVRTFTARLAPPP